MHGVNHREEDELLRRLRAGDRRACADCIERYGADMYHLALRLMRDEREAEDVLQESFTSAFQGIDGFRGHADLGTWLYRITYNMAMMRLRRNRPPTVPVEETLQGEAPVPRQLHDWCCLPERELATEEMRDVLEEALDALSPALRAAFVLREMEGLSTRESAAVLEISEDAVKKRLQRARLELRELLSAYFQAEAVRSPGREYD